jgi:hypothetical protein
MSNSIGDLKNSGLQGNNFPWQLKMLKGLQALIDNGCCDQILALLAPQERKAEVLNTNTTGTVPVCYSFSIANVGATAGLVDGVSVPAGAVLNFDAGTLNNTLTGIGYDATGTTFLISYIVDAV